MRKKELLAIVAIFVFIAIAGWAVYAIAAPRTTLESATGIDISTGNPLPVNLVTALQAVSAWGTYRDVLHSAATEYLYSVPIDAKAAMFKVIRTANCVYTAERIGQVATPTGHYDTWYESSGYTIDNLKNPSCSIYYAGSAGDEIVIRIAR